MTPVYFHNISVIISERRKFLFYTFVCSFCVLVGSSLLRHFISIDHTLLRLISAMSGVTLFWCAALCGLWLCYRKDPIDVKPTNSALNFFQSIGQVFHWLYSIIFGLWFVGLIIMTIFIPFSVLFS